MSIEKVRNMQSFMDELTSMTVSKEEALRLLVNKGFDHKTDAMTKTAIDRYFDGGIESCRIYERIFFFQEISKEEAKRVFESGNEVFLLNYDGSESLIKNTKDFDTADVFGIEITH